MKEILTRLQEFEYIKMVVFAEEVILKVKFSKFHFASYPNTQQKKNLSNLYVCLCIRIR